MSGAIGDKKHNSRYFVTLRVSMKKRKPTANMFPSCDSTAVPLCLSVTALKDHLSMAVNNDYFGL